MPDEPDDGAERPVASWLVQHLDAPPAADPFAGLPPPPTSTPPTPIGRGTRIGCPILEVVLFVACLGIGWIIWWIALWPNGTTPARWLLHLDLVRADGRGRPSAKRAVARDLASKVLLPLAPLNALVALASGRGLWDRILGTTVVPA